MPRALNDLNWLGRGPWETYADKDYAKIDRYREQVDSAYVSYVRPQESGRKSGVRSLELTDATEQTLAISSDHGFGATVWPFFAREIGKAGKQEYLQPSDRVWVRLDAAQMGVGGDNVWSLDARPHAP